MIQFQQFIHVETEFFWVSVHIWLTVLALCLLTPILPIMRKFEAFPAITETSRCLKTSCSRINLLRLVWSIAEQHLESRIIWRKRKEKKLTAPPLCFQRCRNAWARSSSPDPRRFSQLTWMSLQDKKFRNLRQGFKLWTSPLNLYSAWLAASTFWRDPS